MTSRIKALYPLAAVAALLLGAGLYMAFEYAPTEATMGEVQRIFYFHVASYWTAAIAMVLNALACIMYIAKRSRWWDAFAASSAEVGIVFCTGGLAMSPLWAKPVWGIWWTWDARLTLTFLTWMMYIAYLLLRGFLKESDRLGIISAVYGMFIVVNVPMVYMANRWYRTMHPQPVMAGGEGSGLERDMWFSLMVCFAGMLVLMVCYMMIRMSLEDDRQRLGLMRRRLRLEETV